MGYRTRYGCVISFVLETLMTNSVHMSVARDIRSIEFSSAEQTIMKVITEICWLDALDQLWRRNEQQVWRIQLVC